MIKYYLSMTNSNDCLVKKYFFCIVVALGDVFHHQCSGYYFVWKTALK